MADFEWLSLIEHTGPFLSIPVLEEAFLKELNAVETPARQRLCSAYEEWRDAVDQADPQLVALHCEWVRLVLRDGLEYDGGLLKPRKEIDEAIEFVSREHGVRIRPDFAVMSDGAPRLLIGVWAPGTNLDAPANEDAWKASPIERMTALCRATETRLGLVTDGERWVLVNAPVDGVSGQASWYARLWFQETDTLRAFITLLEVRRCLGRKEERLESLLDKSLEHQDEVTDTLGQQVRRAVEVLVQALDRADEDRKRDLLHDVDPRELYEAGLTVMMRLVFVLSAEERGLLLLGDPVYDACYAVSPLRAQLAEEASRHGVKVLEERHDAWSRLLAVFRAVYGGIEHESLRLPALGGSLFDPDRFPLLEGRQKGTNWKEEPARPLPIDNRTVLMLLEALQVLEQRRGALLLSYKALDVEQIGHVYEGLLEYTVGRVPRITLGLVGSQKAKNPDIALAELESARLDGEQALMGLLLETTGRSEPALRNALSREADDAQFHKLLQACGGDIALAERIKPFAGLLRTDNWGAPLVYKEGAFAVTLGADRGDTGTHYTPKALTEKIVEDTLLPVVFRGPSEGLPRDQWELKSSRELLDLKICDPAMGSGAFLVQVCRWFAERVIEAWANEEARGKVISSDGRAGEPGQVEDPMPAGLEERLIEARRLVAERCLYGVDMNPMAVELAKLSLWLTTLARGRPFGFLDHNLRCGDSLLGIHRLDQLTALKMEPSGKDVQMRLFGRDIERAVEGAITLRKRLRETPIRDIRDVRAMARLDDDAKRALDAPERVADALIGEAFRNGDRPSVLEAELQALAAEAEAYLDGDNDTGRSVTHRSRDALALDQPVGKAPRRPFHWPIQFPEVFARANGGFDALVGNPPFLGGKRISTVLGARYNSFLATIHPPASKNTDLVAHFFRRSFMVLRKGGNFGLLAVNTIAEGDTRQGGLEWITRNGATIYAAFPNEPWPGKAAVVTSRVHIHRNNWEGVKTLSGRVVSYISAFLSDREEWNPKRLKANENRAFQGSIVLGMGFVLSHEQAQRMLDADPRNAEAIFPYLNGDDLNSDPEQRASRWVINFWDWPEEKAESYREPYAWIKEHVYSERLEKSKQKSYRNIMSKWWQHWNVRSGLYHAIGRGNHFIRHPKGWRPDAARQSDRVLAITRHSKSLVFSFVEPSSVFSDATVIFALERYRDFALLQSAIHGVYAWQYGSRLKNDLRYTPSDIFETFPFPNVNEEKSDELEGLGRRLDEKRRLVMHRDNIGLTKLYRLLHNPDCKDASISEMRMLHCEIDNAVIRAYGWDGVDLGYGFHAVPYLPSNDCTRYTISESARREVLRRAAGLNRKCYQEEGKYNDPPNITGGGFKNNTKAAAEERAPLQESLNIELFMNGSREYKTQGAEDYLNAAEPPGSYEINPVVAVRKFLVAKGGGHTKVSIAKGTGLTERQCSSAIKELVARGDVESDGDIYSAKSRRDEGK